ncbi:hypothetical protein A33O_17129 [Nitratireductor aquibiodomus RA22]|uniref:Uncharacterized conserved protein, tellurite resistance protein B (TerB) family n=2 Tax=Nitratireductor aquibiodomus TaxID=204799 RepID=A0A1H4IP50_9HYPH|nr:TerB family tellurite resistance protein [Nitratireductor aquibiodomus]EIM73061.1 hypothetical protein A33O_17129 [Nitratireductor aquibiodomus RA22]SEB35078.1 Uncharacterized conserved protein, tellurite resistance protein B (TerB) family [Nitratireductor aquibiodomus]
MSAALNAMAADVLLLLRLALTDEVPGNREKAVLGRFASAMLKLSEDDTADIVGTLEALATETEVMQARASLRQMSQERRLILAETLFELAMRDAELASRTERLTARVCDVLGLGADEVAHLSG